VTYNKQGDFHEVLDGTSTVHIPGKLDGRFEIPTTNASQRAIKFGIEVCLDHVYQTVGKETPFHYGDADIHIISSAQVRERKECVSLRHGGYLVHAWPNDAYPGVKQFGTGWLGGTSLGDANVFLAENTGHPLRFWEIDLGDLSASKGT